LKVYLGLALVLGLSAFSTNALSVSPSVAATYHRYEDVVVSRFSSNSWKILSSQSDQISKSKREWKTHSIAVDPSLSCRGVLGDGWHVPSEQDWSSDYEEISKTSLATSLASEKFWLSNVESDKGKTTFYRAGNFSNNQVVRVSTVKASTLPTVCVCGPRVTDVDLRRTKSRCAGFKANVQTTPEAIEYIRDPNDHLRTGNLQTALELCAREGMRVPSYAEIDSAKDKISSRLKGQGCVWSSTVAKESKGEKFLVHSFESGLGALGMGKTTPKFDGCYLVCVL